MDLFAGKATFDQIARRLGVHGSTVEGWRQDAMGGVTEALRRGSGKTPQELQLERKNQELEQVLQRRLRADPIRARSEIHCSALAAAGY